MLGVNERIVCQGRTGVTVALMRKPDQSRGYALITSISDDAAKVQFGIDSFQYDKQTIIDRYT